MPKKNPIRYWKAAEVQGIAEAIIPDFHEHIAGLTVLYVFRSEAAEAHGRRVLGKARKVSGLNAYLAFRHLLDDVRAEAGAFYVIEIAYDTWECLTDTQRIALVDHELSHIGPDGIVAHDVEEFKAVIERHGLWQPSLESFHKAGEQKPLFKAAKSLRPKKGSGIDSVTISAHGRSVTLTNKGDVPVTHTKDVH
jgi:predicted metallopeptidase